MENKNKLRFSSLALIPLVLWLVMVSPILASCPPSKNRSGCKDCIAEEMRFGCPSCVPLLRCMARCLWGGSSRSKCMAKCDPKKGWPILSDCKRCMSRCKCSCAA